MQPNNNYNKKKLEESIKHRINDEILSDLVRIVGSSDPDRNGVFPTAQALAWATEAESDLVEITANASPPVCRIIDYSKFKYELKKREKENKAKQHEVILKEIRLSPNTDEHDFNFKLAHARKFFTEGNKVKAMVVFMGRSIVYKHRGEQMLNQFAASLEDIAKVETQPKMEGKRMHIILAPKK